METPTVIVLIILLAVVVILLYYFWYIKCDTTIKKEISQAMIYEQDMTITELLKNVSEKYGKYPALKKKIDGKWKEISYYEYWNLSNNFAKRLSYFVASHPRVAILSFNRPEWFYVHMGTMIANGISIGIYPTATTDNCDYIINHACVELLVVEDEKQLAKLYNVKMPTIKLILTLDHIDETEAVNQELIENIQSNNESLKIMPYDRFMGNSIGNVSTNTTIEFGRTFPEDTATIIYTSGTTGDPKGVVVSHKNIMSSIKQGLYTIQSRSNISIYVQERFVSYLPLNHVAAQMMDIYVPLASVGVVHFADKDALKGSLKDTLKDVRPTVFIGVPRVWEKVMEKIKSKEDPRNFMNQLIVNKFILKEIGLDKAKYCITAAAPMTQETKDFFSALGIELCNVYGMSETTGPISMSVPGYSKGSGVPVMDVKIDKKTGEILVKGDAVFSTYYKNEKATNETFNEKGWLKTGDTGYIDRDGSLFVSGRIKDIIVTAGGENVSPIPIEHTLLENLNQTKTLFDHVVVIGDQRKFLSVLLVPSDRYYKHKPNAKQIMKAIADTNKKAPNNTSTIKKYLVLDDEKFEIGDCLTPTLKIRRKVINDKYKTAIDTLYV